LVLGSSLRVSTWAVDEAIERGAKVFIVNLQITPYDKGATVIHARTDEVLTMLMSKLGLEIPKWKLHRRMKISTSTDKKGKQITLKAAGLDTVDRPYLYATKMDAVLSKFPFGTPSAISLKNPFEISRDIQMNTNDGKGIGSAKLTFHLVSYYNEPPIIIEHPVELQDKGTTKETVYSLYIDPDSAKWEIYDESKQNTNNNKNDNNNNDATLESKKQEVELLTIGNTHQLLKSGEKEDHKWTIFVRGADLNTDYCGKKVSGVTFRLHPTFSPDQISLDKPPFEISKTGWGTFKVDIDLKLANGKVSTFAHNLKFEDEASFSTVAI